DNTIIVDTPGIGGSEDRTKKLMEYLHNAVSFIFVIDITKAGGMQTDRLPRIMRSIFDLQIADEMPCFDPKGVIFITNKWDALQGTHEDGEEDIRTRTWRHVKTSIKRNWPDVKEENIFQLSLLNVKKGISDDVDTFKKIQETLDNVIRENENIRKLLDDVKIDIHARLKSVSYSEEEQTLSLEETQKKVKKLKDDCVEKSKQFRDCLDELITKIADENDRFATTKRGKETILNPKGHVPIIDTPYSWKIKETVLSRVDMYVYEIARSPDVKEKFSLMMSDIKVAYEDMLSELSYMEREWAELAEQQENEPMNNETVEIYPMWLPVVVIGLVLALQSGVGVDIAPLTSPFLIFREGNEQKHSKIDQEYEECIKTLHSSICKELEQLYKYKIQKSIDKITDVIVPRRIKKLEDIIQTLSSNRQHIIENQEHLQRLSTKIALINKERDDICKVVNALTKA
ncbi:uncharacterized protein LOC134282231, partial [Saccostrea cucullata]|uniref:uncharacterized protein LOC134282231 n=1 Tax=Saccostrea cuccullata TaxID=36930 RepID=UPI002ED4AF4F